MSGSDHDNSRGFLPPDQLHRQPPSNNLPAGHDDANTTQESELIGRAIFNLGNGVTAANTHNQIRKTASNFPSSAHQQTTQTTTVTPPATTLGRSMSDTISTDHQKTITKSPKSTTTATHSSNRSKENCQFKRLRKMEEMVRYIEDKCWKVRREFESGVAQHHLQDANPSQATVQVQDEEVKQDCVAFKRLDDGGLRIQLSCSCGKRFEFLRNHNDCFYRLI